MQFSLQSDYSPAGDQPEAIARIKKRFTEGDHQLTLLGATGTGKTFTIANIIQELQKPTLIISHNKTLAAQLATEFKHFFPKNAVHYFVSYFDYYQPESYLPSQGLYIEKEATINAEIEMYRLGAMASLLTRPDTIIVASASSLYGLGQKANFQENCIHLEQGKFYDFGELKRNLLKIQYKPTQSKIEHGMFDVQGERIDVFASTENVLYRLHFDEEQLDFIEIRDATSYEFLEKRDQITIWPATQFLQDITNLEEILQAMDNEKEERIKEFLDKKMPIEAERIKKRVEYDIRMIRETGFVGGIENYSRYFDHREPGEVPNTIFDYFPKDFLLIIDESHMTLPQLKAMPAGDKARKDNLIDFGFRLPSAADHRPLGFHELQAKLGRDHATLSAETKQAAKDNHELQVKTIFLSATPSEFELVRSQDVIQQIIRPTGLLDPITFIYPKSGDYALLKEGLNRLLTKKPHLEEFLEGYTLKDGVKEVFLKDENSKDETSKDENDI